MSKPRFPAVVLQKSGGERDALPVTSKAMVFEDPVPISRKYMELEQQMMQPPLKPPSVRKYAPPVLSKLGKASDCLDGFALIEAVGLADPKDVTEATVTNRGFRKVNDNDGRYFIHLNYLVADDNLLKFADLGCFASLQELHLRCNRVTTLTCHVGSFPALISLDVSFNQVDPHSLPHLGSIPSLRSLNLSSNGITELTNGLANLSNITTFILDGNKLSPNAVSKLALMPNLQSLDIASNGLTSFQSSNFPALVRLNLASNNIEDPHDIQVCAAIRHLQQLVLWNNPFTDQFLPGMPTSSILPSRPDVAVVAVDPLTFPVSHYQLHGGHIQQESMPPIHSRQAKESERKLDAARNLRELLDMSSTPEPTEAPAIPNRAFKGAAGGSGHGGFTGKARPMLNRGRQRRKDVFHELRTSLISKSSGLFDGRPDPTSWRSTKAMEARRRSKNMGDPNYLPEMRC